MADVNRVTLHGHLGGDPEVRALDGGGRVATMSVATTERFKDRSGADSEKTTWHRVVAWGWLADACADLRKGARVIVDGKLDVREWTDKNDQKRTTVEIVAWSVSEVVRRPRADASARSEPRSESRPELRREPSRRPEPQQRQAASTFDDDEIPF